MRLLVQRVARATVEVGSSVESRIGPGLVLTLALTAGDSVPVATQLATKVLALNLWPELLDADTPWKTNVVDNGYEVLVMLQPSLCATFPKNVPEEQRTLGLAEAKPIMEAFTATLQGGYQEEMVVLAPLDAPTMRLETTSEGASTFVLGAGDKSAAATAGKAAAQAKAVGAVVPARAQQLKPELPAVTKALQNVPALAKNRATLESARVFQALGQEAFRVALAEAAAEETDAFAEALDAAAQAFSRKQKDQITQWTGLSLSTEGDEEEDEAAPAELGEDQPDDLPQGELERQMAELRGEVADPSKGIAAAKRRREGKPVKEEDEEKEQTVRKRPDATGHAAPETPAAMAARSWAASRAQAPWARDGGKAAAFKGKGGKGKGKGGRGAFRSMGIASLDVASSLHGAGAGGYQWSQSTHYSDKELHLTARDGDAGRPAKRQAVAEPALRLLKGTPTVAPMCPPAEADGDDI